MITSLHLTRKICVTANSVGFEVSTNNLIVEGWYDNNCMMQRFSILAKHALTEEVEAMLRRHGVFGHNGWCVERPTE